MLQRPVEPASTSIAFSNELREAPHSGSIGSVGDALDNALMEATIGLYKTELDVERSRSWTNRAEVERETAAWVHWYNTERPHSSIAYTLPTKHEERYRQNVPSTPEVA